LIDIGSPNWLPLRLAVPFLMAMAIVGASANKHESGIHADGALDDPQTIWALPGQVRKPS
jgi:isopropylmalate/homocitrate/citramalate synthase